MSNKEILKTLLEKFLNNNLTILEKKNELELNDIKYCKENIKNFESKIIFNLNYFFLLLLLLLLIIIIIKFLFLFL